MSYSLNAWATSREDPVGAAMRANTTAARQFLMRPLITIAPFPEEIQPK